MNPMNPRQVLPRSIPVAKIAGVRKSASLLREDLMRLSLSLTEVQREMPTWNSLSQLDSISDLEYVRLQMAMDRLSKVMSTLSNLVKKASETQNQITQNLK
jgi:hypothetical protein